MHVMLELELSYHEEDQWPFIVKSQVMIVKKWSIYELEFYAVF